MNDVEELLHTVEASGATIRVDGSDLKVKPAGILPPDLKAQLRERKAEILRRLKAPKTGIPNRLELEASTHRLERNLGSLPSSDSDFPGTGELEASMRRLEASGISIAVWEDGSMRVVVAGPETTGAITDGGTIYSSADMYHYLHLEPHERRMLHEFKKRFGGTVEWRPAQ